MQTKRFKNQEASSRAEQPSCRELPLDAARVSAQLRKRHERHGTAPDAGEDLSLLHNFLVWLVQTNTQGELEHTNINRLVTNVLATTIARGYTPRVYWYTVLTGVKVGTLYLWYVRFVEDTEEAITCAILLMGSRTSGYCRRLFFTVFG